MTSNSGRRVQAVQWLGLPTDVHSSHRRGPALAPVALRRMREAYAQWGNDATERGQEAGTDFVWHDLGDLPLDASGEADRLRIVDAAAAAAGRGPLLSLGGDHSVSYPLVEGLAQRHGPLNVLHFDAHPDLYDLLGGDPLSHASPFARLLERGRVGRLVQVGIRASNRHQREQALRFGVTTIEAHDFVAAEVPIPAAPLYVSIDLDVFDPAFAPGVSHPEPGGLWVRDVLRVLRRIDDPLIGGDVVEYNPITDRDDTTAVVAIKLAKELAGCMLAPPAS